MSLHSQNALNPLTVNKSSEVNTMFRDALILTIVVGERVFDIAGGPPNVRIVVYIHRVHK